MPAMLTVEALYDDPDPAVSTPDEGYYVGYADFAKQRWVLSGPHRTGQTRLPIPDTADVVSDGGNIYSVVLTCSGQSAVIQFVRIGYDMGEGYEEYWLTDPPGECRYGNS